MHLGIDFGTSYSSAAYVRDARLVAVKEPLRGQSASVPSVVALDRGGRLEVGLPALAAAPERRCSEFKQYLGDDEWPLLIGGREFRPAELVTAVLGCLQQEAAAAGAAADSAVLTVPASYGPHRRELMRQAALAAGFQRADILDEPVAAAIYYAAEGGLTAAEGDVLLVYDLGGGTFDAALVKRTADAPPYETIAAAGIPDCGGIDFDTAIFHDLQQQLPPEIRARLQADTSPDSNLCGDARLDTLYARQEARDFCREFKELLSALEEHTAVAHLAVPPHPHPTYSLTRERFEAVITPLVEETLELCNGLVRDTGSDWDQISQILLVGGSCRIPYIRRELERFKRPVLRVDDLELAVAYGAALRGRELDEVEKVPESPGLYLRLAGSKTRVMAAQAYHDARLAARYAQGRWAEQEQDWAGAVVHYQAISGTRSGYRDVAARLAECGRHRDIAALQEQLRAMFTAGEFQAVADIATRLAELDPAAADPDGLTTQALQRIQEKEEATRRTADADSSHSVRLPEAPDESPRRAWRGQVRIEKKGLAGRDTIALISLTHETHTLVARWAWGDYLKLDGIKLVSSANNIVGKHTFAISDGPLLLAAQVDLGQEFSDKVINQYKVLRLVVDGQEIPLRDSS